MATAQEHGVPEWELHHRLNRALEYAGMKVSAMADYLGVTGSTMSNYLSGRTRPRDGALRSWALRCGVSFEWLVFGIPTPDDGDGGSRLPGTQSGCTTRPILTALRPRLAQVVLLPAAAAA